MGRRGGGFHVIVPGVRFCTAGRLLGAALPTAATTAAIMCGEEQREDATEAPARPSVRPSSYICFAELVESSRQSTA